MLNTFTQNALGDSEAQPCYSLQLRYCKTFGNPNISSLLAPMMTPIVGAWHPYKYACQTVYELDHPMCASLKYVTFINNPTSTTMTRYRKLIVVERMIFGIFVVQKS